MVVLIRRIKASDDGDDRHVRANVDEESPPTLSHPYGGEDAAAAHASAMPDESNFSDEDESSSSSSSSLSSSGSERCRFRVDAGGPPPLSSSSYSSSLSSSLPPPGGTKAGSSTGSLPPAVAASASASATSSSSCLSHSSASVASTVEWWSDDDNDDINSPIDRDAEHGTDDACDGCRFCRIERPFALSAFLPSLMSTSTCADGDFGNENNDDRCNADDDDAYANGCVGGTGNCRSKKKHLASRTFMTFNSPPQMLRLVLTLSSALSLLTYTQCRYRTARLVALASTVHKSYESAKENLFASTWGDQFRARDLEFLRTTNARLKEEMERVWNESATLDMEQDAMSNDAAAEVALVDENEVEQHKRALQRDEEKAEYIVNLIEDMREKDFWDVVERFGEGPHYVRFYLDFPAITSNIESTSTPTSTPTSTSTFVVKLAPLDLMPHTVNVFLDAVSRGMYNDGNMAFTINAPHLVKTSPAYPSPSSYSDVSTRHHSAHTEPPLGPVYPEYHPDYPHLKYTLGYVVPPPPSSSLAPSSSSSSSSRDNDDNDDDDHDEQGSAHGDGGFYINVLDNTENHGPGHQMHHNSVLFDQAGDPCFGIVVEGMDVIDRLSRARTINNYNDYTDNGGAKGKQEQGKEEEGGGDGSYGNDNEGGSWYMWNEVPIRSAKIVSCKMKRTWKLPPWLKY